MSGLSSERDVGKNFYAISHSNTNVSLKRLATNVENTKNSYVKSTLINFETRKKTNSGTCTMHRTELLLRLTRHQSLGPTLFKDSFSIGSQENVQRSDSVYLSRWAHYCPSIRNAKHLRIAIAQMKWRKRCHNYREYASRISFVLVYNAFDVWSPGCLRFHGLHGFRATLFE